MLAPRCCLARYWAIACGNAKEADTDCTRVRTETGAGWGQVQGRNRLLDKANKGLAKHRDLPGIRHGPWAKQERPGVGW